MCGATVYSFSMLVSYFPFRALKKNVLLSESLSKLQFRCARIPSSSNCPPFHDFDFDSMLNWMLIVANEITEINEINEINRKMNSCRSN